jgi:hypothetical protein
MTDIWTMLEDATDERASIADLYHWSTNYDAGQGPFTLFLDMIGWSEENIGQPLYSLADANLGYVELSKLGAALVQYADTPHDVRAFVDELMQA